MIINACRKKFKKHLKRLQRRALKNGLREVLLEYNKNVFNYDCNQEKFAKWLIIPVVFVCLCLLISSDVINNFISARCLVPSNYFVWEASRPIADCSYCRNVTKPIILKNITRQEFLPYAFTSGPIIVKDAIKNWKAFKKFSFRMFKELYEQTEGSYESLDEGCQFLNFKTDLFSLKDVLNMPEERARNEDGQEPWYVGWGNCHPSILSKVRQYYSVPEFLPEDAEYPGTENIFFGYEIGAVMHLDYIPRLMWQGQVKGNKTWSLAPVPECEDVCQKFEYYVEPGDVVLLDTRLWYHATRIPKGQFSLTVQSEYG